MSRGTPLVIRAEQALLGAILSDPAGQAQLLDLVEPDDMSRPYHGQVLAAMQRLRGSGTAPGPVAASHRTDTDARASRTPLPARRHPRPARPGGHPARRPVAARAAGRCGAAPRAESSMSLPQ